MTYRLTARVGLGWLAFVALQLGAWALLAPRSFYDDFPGFGRSWVSVDGPFNQHLVRDVGALNLAIAVLLVYAAIRLSRDLVFIAAIVSLAWGVPHLIYHLFNAEALSTVDKVMSLSGLALSVVFAALLLWVGRKIDDQGGSGNNGPR